MYAELHGITVSKRWPPLPDHATPDLHIASQLRTTTGRRDRRWLKSSVPPTSAIRRFDRAAAGGPPVDDAAGARNSRVGFDSADRLAHLDGLRGVAVLCVVCFHAGYFLVPSLHGKLLPGGFLGVDLFFVLSGFLMTVILTGRRSGPHPYRRFLIRRAVRILPALYLFLLCYLLYTVASSPVPGSDARATLPIALGVGNWSQTFGSVVPFSLVQTWSLGVEQQFYLLWPIVVFGVARWRRWALMDVCLLGLAVSAVLPVVLDHAGVSKHAIYTQTWTRMVDFLAGAVVALLWREGRSRVRHLTPLLVGAGALLVAMLASADPYGSGWLYDGGFALVALCCATVLYACLTAHPATTIFCSRPLRTVGRFSYSMYLWHPFIFFACSRVWPHQVAPRVAVALVLLVAAPVSSTRWVEEPLRGWVARRLAAPGATRADPVAVSRVAALPDRA